MRWDADKVAAIKATPRRPNPQDPDKADTDLGHKEPKIEKPEELRQQAKEDEGVIRRNFRITKRLIEKYGHTSGCIGCEALMEGRIRGARDHTRECRARIEKSMKEDPEDKVWINKRDERSEKKEKDKGRVRLRYFAQSVDNQVAQSYERTFASWANAQRFPISTSLRLQNVLYFLRVQVDEIPLSTYTLYLSLIHISEPTRPY